VKKDFDYLYGDVVIIIALETQTVSFHYFQHSMKDDCRSIISKVATNTAKHSGPLEPKPLVLFIFVEEKR